MRITEGMMTSQLLQDLQANFDRLTQQQAQLSSGRKIVRPSDDPAGTQADLRWRSNLAQLQQYSTNMDQAKDWLSQTDTSLSDAGDLLMRVRQLAAEGANSTMPQESLDSLAQEVAQLQEELVTVGNTALGDRYIFAGTNAQQAPFAVDASTNTLTYNGYDAPVMRQFGPGVQMDIGVAGIGAKFQNAYAAMEDVRQALLNGDHSALSNALQTVSDAYDTLLAARTEAGAKMARVQLAQNRTQAALVDLQQLLASTEDADMSKVAIQFAQAQNAYQLALASGARLVQPTLMDFLR